MMHGCTRERQAPAEELHPARILGLLETSRLGRTVVLLEKVPSTNSAVVEAAANGAREGTLVIAEEQDEGRGRKGRRWYSRAGKSLVFSIILRPVRGFEGLTSLIALGAASAIEGICGGIKIKWPNDIYLNGKKMGGILAEAKNGFVVMGMGLNINELGEDFPGEIAEVAISLRMVTGGYIDRGVVLARVISTFETMYMEWADKGLLHYKEGLEDRILYLNEYVYMESGESRFSGKLLGIEDNGYIRLEIDGRESVFSSGDITPVRGGG